MEYLPPPGRGARPAGTCGLAADLAIAVFRPVSLYVLTDVVLEHLVVPGKTILVRALSMILRGVLYEFSNI